VSKEIPRILMAGGGTGGHLFPALAVADEIRNINPRAVVWFVGTKTKIEARVVPAQGYEFRTIWISGFHRSLRLDNLLFPLKVLVSLVQSFFLIKQFRPDVAVGTGGYVCGPVLAVASLLGIPTVVHESNSYPGATTKMLAGKATRVFTAFDVTSRWLKRTDNIERVGTPTRDSLDGASRDEALRYFGLDAEKKTVLVVGGSHGATSINKTVGRIAVALRQQNAQVIWQTGQSDFERMKESFEGRTPGWIGAFIDRMDLAYAAAHVVVSRSGATTIAELTRIGKAAILVPFPFAAADHQTMNAKALTDAGAAVLVLDRELDDRLEDRSERASCRERVYSYV
jgi:UDP-N-acetylglucosamine--N-acetylmuramyl-(pentapeptide) pyrophosphoryl-undecaprenol N-acetylglucosamine transferase